MTPPPNMTKEQLRELKQLRKDEAQKTKAVTKLEKSIRREMTENEKIAMQSEGLVTKEYQKEIKAIRGLCNKALKDLRTQLARLQEGRIPEAAALKAIRRRIAILEGRTTS